MISTKENPSHFDGLERAEPGEPVFPLRAHDRHAAQLVHEWVRLRRDWIATADIPEAKRKLELIQASEAEEMAWAMEAWRAGQPIDADATPAPALPASYSGNTLDAEELAAKERFDAIAGAGRLLRNAVSDIADACAALEAIGIPTEVLGATISQVNACADQISPKRASYAHKAG